MRRPLNLRPSGHYADPRPDLLADDDPGFVLVEHRHALGVLLARLPERERQIVSMRFYGNLTQTEIAERVGLSQMHVSRLLHRSLEFLRRRLT
jgi:RNA polymerase sigma-B factor